MRPELGWCVWILLAGCSAPEPPRAPTVPESEIEPQPLRIVPLPPGIEPLVSLVPDPPHRPAPSASSALLPPTRTPLPGALPASVATALATAVESFYQRAVPLDCNFIVEAFDNTSNRLTTRRAQVVFAGPSEFLATLSSGTIVVAHASTLATYDAVAQQWFSTPVAPDFLPVALSYAGGPGSLTNKLELRAFRDGTTSALDPDLLVGWSKKLSANAMYVGFSTRSSGEVTRTRLGTLRGNHERWDRVQCAAARPTPLPVPSNPLPLSAANAKLLDEVASLTTAIP